MVDDLRVLFDMLAKLGAAAPSDVVSFVQHGTPVPKERPRWSAASKTFYTPNTTKVAEEALSWKFKNAMQGRRRFDDTVALVGLFYVPSFQRRDTDNLLKLVMDAGNKARIWRDDADVIAHAVFLELDREHPRTVVAIWPYLGSHTRAPLFYDTERTTACRSDSLTPGKLESLSTVTRRRSKNATAKR